MEKLQVTHDDSWELQNGERVDYYKVGQWYMELIDNQVDEELEHAKHSIKVYKAWYKFLKKKAKKNPRH